MGGEFEELVGGLLTISCIQAQGGGPFVGSFLDSCSLERAFSFCGGMSGSCHDLLGNE